MRNLLLSVAFLTAVLFAQPTFDAFAKTQIFVSPDGQSDQEKADSDDLSGGRPKLFNTTPGSSRNSMPFRSIEQSSKSKSSSNLSRQKIPASWKVLDEAMINNRLADTRAALKFSMAQKQKLVPSKLDVGEPDVDERDVMRDAEKTAKKVKKKSEKKLKEFTESAQEGAQASADSEKPSNKKTHKKGIKIKKGKDSVPSRKVFNLPD